jgi:hypothetical protein
MNEPTADRRSPLGLFPGESAPQLYDRVVEVPRTRHYSRRTEDAYLHWIRRFLLFHNGTHPPELAENDVNGFPTKDRVTMLPDALLQALQDHLRRVRKQHQTDLKSGLGQAPLPHALARKYPNAGREWGWQWVFPAPSHVESWRRGVYSPLDRLPKAASSERGGIIRADRSA